MEKHFFTELEAVSMASSLSDNLYYADKFSRASFDVFCKNLPKPVVSSVQSTYFDHVTHCLVSLTFSDFKTICIVFNILYDSDQYMFNWLINFLHSNWSFKLDHYYSYLFFKH